MITVGKLGANAGQRAVDVIRSEIDDSSPSVTAARERVCERILSPEADWVRCEGCTYGNVHGTAENGFSTTQCSTCKAIGYIRK